VYIVHRSEVHNAPQHRGKQKPTTSLKRCIDTLNNNASSLIHPGTRARQSRTSLLSGNLSLGHRSELSLSALEHPTRRSSVHAISADRHTVTPARARRTVVVAASVEDAHHGHLSKVFAVGGLAAGFGAVVGGVADVGSLGVGATCA
jgi:hypothetical protein